MKRELYVAELISVAIFGLTAQASAQDAAPSGGPGQPSTTIETVVVTAQKRAEPLVDVPVSVAAVSATQLNQSGVTSLVGLQQIVPGFRMQFAGADAQPTIRGVGSQVAGAGNPANVATYVDGFYRPDELTSNVEFIDTTSVEVLKGPQGTLFGRNATGGAILVNTETPSLNAPEAEVHASYGNFNDARLAAFGSLPLTDDLAVSLSVYGRTTDSYTRNIVLGTRDGRNVVGAVRGKILYQPSDKLKFTLTFEQGNIVNPGSFAAADYHGQATGALLGGVISAGPGTTAANFRPIFRSNETGVFLKSELDLSFATLTSLTGAQWQHYYSGYDIDGSSLNIESATFPGSEQTYQQEFDLTSKSEGPLKWVAGAYLYSDHSVDNLFLVSVTPSEKIIDGGVLDSSYALFADATYNLWGNLYLTAGARYSADHLNGYFEAPPLFDRHRANVSYDAFTPRAVIRYQLDDNSNIYASYNQGYKAGGYNVFQGNLTPVSPEKIKAYEVGYKTARQDWQLEAAAFYYDYSNLQVTAYKGLQTELINAAAARIFGGEVHATGQVSDSWVFDTGLSYVNARYTSFPGAPFQVWDPTNFPANGTGFDAFAANASGNPLTNAPDFTGDISLTYSHELWSGTIALNGTYAYQTTTYFDPGKQTSQPGYGILNLTGSWAPADANYQFGAYIRNATNEHYIQSLFSQPIAISTIYGAPLTFGVDITWRH